VNALEAAVVGAPSSIPARLVYADWLVEHGDAARGEFIQIQCASPSADRATRIRLEDRARFLLAEHGERRA
jgi:uncharacterized protein (TIGR02996 family)